MQDLIFKEFNTYEIMVHTLLEKNIIVDYDRQDLKKKLEALFSKKKKKFKIINYSDF